MDLSIPNLSIRDKKKCKIAELKLGITFFVILACACYYETQAVNYAKIRNRKK